VIVSIFAWPSWQLRHVNELSLEAYAEQRQIDFQLPGAPYSRIHRERGASTEQPPALLDAESIVAAHADHVNDPRWMEARGRVELLAGEYTRAITDLESALKAQPDSDVARMDLAAAYFENGQAQQSASDFQKAYDLLSKILEKDPQNRAALYNRALTAAEMKESAKAIEDLTHYLQLDSASGWADKVRQKLAEIKKPE
jgi:tetratricopeptide (TPR) repeat protein